MGPKILGLLVVLLGLLACGGERSPSATARPTVRPLTDTPTPPSGAPAVARATLSIPAGDVTLHASTSGDLASGNVLVVLHGGPGMSSDYMASLESLAGPELAVVIYDQRGAGRSTSPPADPAHYDLLKYVADLEAVRQAVGAERLHLLGHSWGGVLAMRYATLHPERVSDLILMGSGPPNWRAMEQGQVHAAQRVGDLRARGIIPQSISTLADILPAYWSDPNFEPPDELKNTQHNPIAEQLTESALGEFDFTAELGSLEQPVLFLYGADDPFGLAMAEATTNALSSAALEFVLLDHCGHFWQECPSEFFSRVRAFLRLPAVP